MIENCITHERRGWRLGELADKDLASLLALERLYPSTPWSEAQWAAALTDTASADSDTSVLGIWHKKQLAGHAVLVNLGIDAELQAIMVTPAWRRHGLGQRLLAGVIERAGLWASERLLLEVRASNSAALALYRRAGFELDGVRKDYYAAREGREDACLMSLRLASRE
ncbi:MAG: GNAT family N-acetyltransferase [Halomonas sp.]|uniref:GNAT family N-acetyltransferase n=1 Tax=Halomonas sp. TaxID=1486246 RepID=UPI003F8DE500